MRHWVASLLAWLLLAACAAAPPAVPRPDALFADARFAPPAERIAAADVFALSDAMRQALHDMAPQLRAKGVQRGLVDALYRPGELKLEYDAEVTRNAREAYEARRGNCLSLVIMTAAFAKELGLAVEYQSAWLEETWSRNGGLVLRSGHVNLTLGRRLIERGVVAGADLLTIDFLPADELRGLRTRTLSESTVIAMFMNNRAAEALVRGRVDDAYWWAREALLQDPSFASAYNTLGVVYLRHGDPAAADAAFAAALAREPDNTRALFNRMHALAALGRHAEADALARRLAQLEPYPPFHFFDLGMAALRRADYASARDLFAREVARADYSHEFHYWLGVAHYRLGEIDQARRALARAIEASSDRGARAIYAAKLAWLKSLQQP